MSETIKDITSYRAPKIKVVDLIVCAKFCQSSNWATETDPEEDQLP